MDNNSNNNDDDADYIEDLHGDGGSAGPSAMSSASLSLQDLDLSRLAVASSKPQRRQRPAGHTHSLPQKSKSAGLATSTSTSTNTSTNTRATPGRPPLRHKSGDLPVSRSSAHRDLSSKSAHAAVGVDAAAAADDWFDFDSGPTLTPIPKHSTASNKSYSSDDTTGEIEGSSFHGEDSRRSSLRLRDRREMARTISEKRLSSTAVTDTEPSPASTPPSRGLARSKSGVPRLPHNSNHRTPPTRVPPTRSRSDALTSSRRESMKALYRTTGNLDEASSSPQLLTSIGKGADGDSTSTVPRQRPRPQRAASGLEAGALSSVIMDRRPPTRSRSTDSANLFSTQEGNNEDSDDEQNQPHDPKWLQRRQSKQDEIMTLAQDVKERFADAREKQEELEYNATTSGGGASGNVDDDLEDDDDQPMAMRTKKTVLEQIKKVANKTGAGARSLGKGTVNAIHDPKLAAKRLGHLSKDVGKATIKTALDPSKLAKGAKNMTVRICIYINPTFQTNTWMISHFFSIHVGANTKNMFIHWNRWGLPKWGLV